MRRYDVSKQRSGDEIVAEVPADNPFAKAAYEWNHALLIAAGKIWGDRPPLTNKES